MVNCQQEIPFLEIVSEKGNAILCPSSIEKTKSDPQSGIQGIDYIYSLWFTESLNKPKVYITVYLTLLLR